MLTQHNTNRFKIQFDTAFVEEAVFLAAKYNGEADDTLIQRFHQDREKIYQCPADQERDASFQQLYGEYFLKLGIRDMFERIVTDFPLLSRPDISVFIKKVWSKKEEDADLYVSGNVKTVCITLMVNRILQPFCLQALLRHELLRISDMLDPNFQYKPDIVLNGKNELENNLIRDRYRILWDTYIDNRLRADGFPVLESVEDKKRALGRAFFFLGEKEKEDIFSKLEKCGSLMQIDLIDLAQDARSVKTLGEGGVRCPLCDFTCYNPVKNCSWEINAAADEIKKDHPQWTPEQGICPQCYELYNCRIKAKG